MSKNKITQETRVFAPSKRDVENGTYPEYAQIVAELPMNPASTSMVSCFWSRDQAINVQHTIARGLRNAEGGGPTLLEQVWSEAVAAYDALQAHRATIPDRDELSRLDWIGIEAKTTGICLGYFGTLAIFTGMEPKAVRAKVVELWGDMPEDD